MRLHNPFTAAEECAPTIQVVLPSLPYWGLRSRGLCSQKLWTPCCQQQTNQKRLAKHVKTIRFLARNDLGSLVGKNWQSSPSKKRPSTSSDLQGTGRDILHLHVLSDSSHLPTSIVGHHQVTALEHPVALLPIPAASARRCLTCFRIRIHQARARKRKRAWPTQGWLGWWLVDPRGNTAENERSKEFHSAVLQT